MKPRKRIAAISNRQAERNKLYAKAVREWWTALIVNLNLKDTWPLCQVQVPTCTHYAEPKPHHKYGRLGSLYWWIPGFMAVCQHCHDKIHRERKWAIANGHLGGMGEWQNTKLCQPKD
jgi:hypothetical protein